MVNFINRFCSFLAFFLDWSSVSTFLMWTWNSFSSHSRDENLHPCLCRLIQTSTFITSQIRKDDLWTLSFPSFPFMTFALLLYYLRSTYILNAASHYFIQSIFTHLYPYVYPFCYFSLLCIFVCFYLQLLSFCLKNSL